MLRSQSSRSPKHCCLSRSFAPDAPCRLQRGSRFTLHTKEKSPYKITVIPEKTQVKVTKEKASLLTWIYLTVYRLNLLCGDVLDIVPMIQRTKSCCSFICLAVLAYLITVVHPRTDYQTDHRLFVGTGDRLQNLNRFSTLILLHVTYNTKGSSKIVIIFMSVHSVCWGGGSRATVRFFK